MKTTHSEILDILLVEDDADDIELLRKALEDNGVRFRMHEITRGDGVAPYLKTCKTLPHVIVMDFNMPRVHGRELLRVFKTHERFSGVPLMVLTTSAAAEDIEYAGRLGANGFLTKPTTVEGFNHAVQTITRLSLSPHQPASLAG
ncbi:MAG TPA: response regulator [Chitinophagales bacterium]|nr:response regulator [Chitinophagales bacterium]